MDSQSLLYPFLGWKCIQRLGSESESVSGNVNKPSLSVNTTGNCKCDKNTLVVIFGFQYRRPDDWTLSWGGSGQIWGWGHNHRGQLGGVEGAKVKLPIGCESLATLRPVQLIGGEQTLFAVTGDGKVLKCTTILVLPEDLFRI